MMSVLSVLILLVVVLSSHAFRPIHSINTVSTGFLANRDSQSFLAIQSIRGGDSDNDSEYDEFVEESDDEDEIVRLSASAKKAMEKAKTKKKAEVKKSVSASLSKTKVKKSKGASTSVLKKIPYIVRALMNPFTVFAMAKGYFASLFNIDYLQEDVSQTLRSALQEKAKSAPSGGKRARKMKPGQAKTLSDLPQLSA
jgi:hypothetical protein